MPDNLMLDEATSNLDSETESVIQKVLQALARRRCTVVLIAHRLSTVMYADSIIVLGSGRIVEQGTHADLLTRRGAYFEMWNRQVPPSIVRQLAGVHTTLPAPLEERL